MCSRQKAVPLGKSSDFSRFFGDFYENERFSREEIRPTLCSTSAFKIVNFRSSTIPEFRSPKFWNSESPEMDHFEGRLCVPRISSKLSIFGVPEFQNP